MDNSPFTDEFPFRNDLTISNMSIHGGYSWIVPLFMGDFHGFSHVPRLDDLGVSSMFFDLCGTPKRRDEAISQLGKSQQWQQALELLQAIQCAFHKKWKGQIHHFITHRIHVWYICQHLPSISPNVSINTSTMDPMGNMSIYVISFPSPVFFGFSMPFHASSFHRAKLKTSPGRRALRPGHLQCSHQRLCQGGGGVWKALDRRFRWCFVELILDDFVEPHHFFLI